MRGNAKVIEHLNEALREELTERLLFLDATPKMDYLPLSVGSNVKEGDDASRHQIKEMGYERYLTMQVAGPKD